MLSLSGARQISGNNVRMSIRMAGLRIVEELERGSVAA
jgi:hypothetical protein